MAYLNSQMVNTSAFTKSQKRLFRSASQERFYKHDIEYGIHKNGRLSLLVYVDKKTGDISREEGPAFIEWHESGSPKKELYFVDDKLHRDPIYGPAQVEYNLQGYKYIEKYWWQGAEVDADFIPHHRRPRQSGGLGRTFL